jgi:hypothetical protein
VNRDLGDGSESRFAISTVFGRKGGKVVVLIMGISGEEGEDVALASSEFCEGGGMQKVTECHADLRLSA